MDIQRVNHVIEQAIMALQAEEVEALFEFSVPTPVEVAKRTGMKLPKKSRKAKEQGKPDLGFWMMYFTGKLTAFDEKLSARERTPNIYRMGHYLKAAQKAEAYVKNLKGSTNDAALEKFRKALKREFESDFPPLKSMDKAIDKYFMTRKRPKYGK